MSPDLIGNLVSSAIPLFGGIYVTLLGYRVVGMKPGMSLKSDEWHARFGRMFQIFGPLMIVFGLFESTMAFVSPVRRA